MPAFQEGFINVGENDEYPNLITDPSMEDLLDGMNFSLAGGGGDSGFSTMGDNATSVLLELPDEMKFGNKNVLVIVAYVNLMWISLLGNSIVLGKLFYRKNRSRVHFMLLHLCIADLLVTVIEMPLQIVWKSTVQWRAGDALCRLLGGLRVVGLYLSAFILIAISIDRFMSVWDPLSTVTRATCRAKVMVFTAWFLSFACASPQLTVWSLRTHPQFTWYQQCVTFEAFSSHSAEMAYGLWISLLMYGFPLITIIICYLGIWLRISYYSKQTQQQEKEGTFRRESRQPSTDNVRHSLLSARRDTISPTASGDILSKAKSRTLKMTVLIVIIFVCCWSPYQLIHVWYYLHRSSAEQVNLLLQETLFIFGVSSCVVDPYVYGLYSMGLWNEVECISRINCTSHSQTPSEDRRGSFASPKDNMEVYSLGTLKKCCPNLAERKGIPSHEDSNKRDEPSPTPATARVIM